MEKHHSQPFQHVARRPSTRAARQLRVAPSDEATDFLRQVIRKRPYSLSFHQNRTVEENFLSMICVDGGLVIGSTSMANALAHPSSTSRVYFFGSREAWISKVAGDLHSCGASISQIVDDLPGVKIDHTA